MSKMKTLAIEEMNKRKEQQQQKQQQQKDGFWCWYIPFMAMIAIIWISIMVIGTWQDAINKDYLGSLTPMERQNIQDTKDLKEIENKKATNEHWKETNDSIDFIMNFPIPLWFIVPLLIITWWKAKRWF